VTNNYWETNFPGAQPGVVTARYAIRPYAGAFDESCAHRFAAEVEHARPVVQHLGEPATRELLPAAGSLLKLPEPPILVLNLQVVESVGAVLTLFNASDVPQITSVSSGLVQIKTAQHCDLFACPLEPLSVVDGAVEILLAPRQLFRLTFS
jgi:alpha-mannosidase